MNCPSCGDVLSVSHLRARPDMIDVQSLCPTCGWSRTEVELVAEAELPAPAVLFTPPEIQGLEDVE